MSVFSYHLVKTSFLSAIKAYFSPINSNNTSGLIHAEYMTAMTLGSPIFSTQRMLIGQVAFFAQWEDERAIDDFLTKPGLGNILAKGWHVRLTFIRQWGRFSKFDIPKDEIFENSINGPVVAVTIARMKLPEVPRFISWGRPVEKLVRDHPGTTLSLAAIRLPQIVSTFSIWKKQKDMTDMVHGHSAVPLPKRHTNAMKERERKDFHFEFTTLRFKPISEHGEWKGRGDYITQINDSA